MSYHSHHQNGRYDSSPNYSEIIRVNATVKDTYITNLIVPTPKKAFDPLSRLLEEIHDYEGYTGSVSVTDSVFTNIDNFVVQYLNDNGAVEASEPIEIVHPNPDVLQRGNRGCHEAALYFYREDLENLERDYENLQTLDNAGADACIEIVNQDEQFDFEEIAKQMDTERELEDLGVNPLLWDITGSREQQLQHPIGQGPPIIEPADPPEGYTGPLPYEVEIIPCEIRRWSDTIENKARSYNCKRALCELERINWNHDDVQKELAKAIKYQDFLYRIQLCEGITPESNCPNRDSIYKTICKLNILMQFRSGVYELIENYYRRRCEILQNLADCRKAIYDQWFAGYPFPSGTPNSWDSKPEDENTLCARLQKCDTNSKRESGENIGQLHGALISLRDWLARSLIACDCDDGISEPFGPELEVLGWDPLAPIDPLPDVWWNREEGVLRRWGLPEELRPSITPQNTPEWDPKEGAPWGPKYRLWSLEWLGWWEASIR